MATEEGKQVQIADAAKLVDRFEELLASKDISIPRNRATSADMLPLDAILARIRSGFPPAADEMRKEYAAGIAVHDLAAKILAVGGHADFPMLVPHLRMLADGAIHITHDPPADAKAADTYNKLIELYWACLLMQNGVSVALDDPEHSTGDNPDVIAMNGTVRARAYAFKTIRSWHTQTLLERLEEGIDQIERSDANEGIVAFHLTPRILQADLWPQGRYWIDWRVPAAMAVELMRSWIEQVVTDNGQPAIDEIFKSKKAAGTVLCFAIFPTVARNPESGNPIVMPLKAAVLVEMSPSKPLSSALHTEIEAANDIIQRRLH